MLLFRIVKDNDDLKDKDNNDLNQKWSDYVENSDTLIYVFCELIDKLSG